MSIIDGSTGKSKASVSLLLTPDEASELADTVNGLDPKVGDHGHVADKDYQREITVAIYTNDNLVRRPGAAERAEPFQPVVTTRTSG